MPERDPLLRLAARVAHGRAIDWDAEEERAASDEARAGIRQLRQVAALSLLNRAVLSSVPGEDLSDSIARAKGLAMRAPALAPGSRFGHLEVHERIGGGAFGEVYRARDPRLDREVALKILAQERSDPRDEVVREARLLARVRHPNVVTVHGADRIAGQVGIWTEFLRGQTLTQVLAERGVLDAGESALIGIELCRALTAVHAAGIVHQDVKLSNVMRAEGGRIVLMDFGLGREIDPMQPWENGRRRLTGTPLFMAPEVVAGARPDARSDLYSVGVVLFALVTGVLPVMATTLDDLRAKHFRHERRRARDLRPDLPEAFARVLERILAPDPEHRPVTAGDAEQELLTCLGTPARSDESALRIRPAAGAPPHRLPAEIDAFVGREAELAALAARFATGSRLVTLLGAGGMGKTRLAARYGWQSLTQWPGGVWFCDLTDARSGDGVVAAVAESLGVAYGGGNAVELLGRAIADRGSCLLICDNFEQVVAEAAETVVRWLGAAPEARFLVTSRERLKATGEDVQALDALPLDRGMELFVERARRLRPIAADGPEAESIREVVRLVEGIPLAIELSAARLRVMTPAQMVDRMAARFRILAGSGAGRHATLRAAIDSSWELLPPWEKAAFAQCAVFEGGFSLEAAEGVFALEAWPDAPWIVDVLQALVDKSLLRSAMAVDSTTATGPPAMRFGMFVSLQEYAREKLADRDAIPGGASGPEAARAAERRHGVWFARLGDDEPMRVLSRERGAQRLRVLAPELENLVAACRRLVALGDGERAAQCFGAAFAIFDMKGSIGVAVELGTQLLSCSLVPRQRARLLNVLAMAEQRSGLIDQGRRHAEESLVIHREIGDPKGETKSLDRLASIALYEGHLELSETHYRSILAIHRETGDREDEGFTLSSLALGLQAQGKLEEASRHFEAALAINREVGNRGSEGIVLGNLADLRGEQGRIEDALALFQAALAIHREVGNRRFEGTDLGNMGSVCLRKGHLKEARSHLEAALAIHREVGNRRFEGEVLADLARLALAQGRVEEARTGFEAALAVHRAVRNRRSEGVVLGQLGALDLAEGRSEAARNHLSQGMDLLQSAGSRIELGKLLCTRAKLERQVGNGAAAQATIGEIEAIAAQAEIGPDSELRQELDTLRKSFARQSM